jgi:hypothetical protein
MIPKPLKSFVDGLLAATDDGQLDWAEGAQRSYYCNHKQYTLHLSYHFDVDAEQSVFNFTIKSKGKDAFFAVTGDEGDYGTMKNLFASVEVSAAGFTDIANDFFS